jgi:hypothetical protein
MTTSPPITRSAKTDRIERRNGRVRDLIIAQLMRAQAKRKK